MKKALLISEASVYKNSKGEITARGGGEISFHNIAKSLAAIGIQPTVFAIQEFKDQSPEEIIEGVAYKRFPVSSKTSFKVMNYLKQALKESKNHDFIFLNQFTPHLLLPWLKNKISIAVIHDVYQNSGKFFWIKQYGILNGTLGNIIEKIQLYFDKKYAKKIMTVSDISAKKTISILGEESAKKITINQFPINKNNFTSSSKKEDFLLFAGRFSKYKHPEDVLHVIKKVKSIYPQYKAVFITPRSEKNTVKIFKKQQAKLGLTDTDVVMKYDCDNAETKELFSKAKILIHPSHTEGQGIVLLEALASKTPVVAYNLPVYEPTLINDKNSLLSELGNKEQLANSALKILNNYEHFQNNCHISLHNFSEENFLDTLKKLCS